MKKTILELINEAYGEPNSDANSSGYGFDSEFNEPVNVVDSNRVMEPENIAAVYFTESDEEEPADSETEEGELLFDYEKSEMVSTEADQDMNSYFHEDMLDISTKDKKSDGEIPPGGIMDEQDFSPPGNVPTSPMGGIASEVQKITNSPEELSPEQMGLDKNMSTEEAMEEGSSFGLAEVLILDSFGRNLDYEKPKEGRMMKSNLYNIAQDAMHLCDMLYDDDDLPQWAHEKLATARDRINSVREYLEAKIANEEG